MSKPEIKDLFYHPENLGYGKTWRDVEKGRWYYTQDLLKIFTLKVLSERDNRVLSERISK